MLSLCSSLPFSFVFIDLEHSPQYPFSALPSTLSFLKSQPTPKPTLVRIPGKDSIPNIQHCLDSGAQHLLIPMISTPTEAGRVVSAAKFPPLGSRGCANSYWNDFGGKGLATSSANEDVTLGVQIETLEGISNAEAIGEYDFLEEASGESVVSDAIIQPILLLTDFALHCCFLVAARVPGVDFVFLGPVDLASAIGVVESEDGERQVTKNTILKLLYLTHFAHLSSLKGWGHPSVEEIVLSVASVVKSEGKAVGTLVTSLENNPYEDFEVNVVLGSQLFIAGAKEFLKNK